MLAFKTISSLVVFLQDKQIDFEIRGDRNKDISIAVIDTRQCTPSSVFFALKGKNTDGHSFLAAAYENSAHLAVVREFQDLPICQIKVSDPLQLLWLMAQRQRQCFTGSVIGITGSCGKTTTKQMLSAIFNKSKSTATAPASFNNHIGVPISLCQICEEQIAILEIGANGPGEISKLTELVKPTVSVITNADRAHLEGFGSIEEVAYEKGCILDQCPETVSVVLNADSQFFHLWRNRAEKAGKNITSFGKKLCADVQIELRNADIVTNIQKIKLNVKGLDLRVNLPIPGAHNALNAAASIAVALQLGLNKQQVSGGFKAMQNMPHRSHVHQLTSEKILIDDSFNCNPLSMRSAIDMLAEVKVRRVLVFGDMLELGQQSEQLHREIGKYASNAEIDCLITYGIQAKLASETFGGSSIHCNTFEELMAICSKNLVSCTAMLVKGSRAMQLDKIVDGLLDISTPSLSAS